MVMEVQREVCNGYMLKWLLAAGLAWLEHHKAHINSLNVFPVPDGDTGTNMVLTVQKAYRNIADLDELNIGVVADAMARGALVGARGNSGTILSMLFRGFANGLAGREVMDAASFALALRQGSDYAYETVRSVMTPVEGTILTVAREAAQAVQDHATIETDLDVLLETFVSAAHTSLQNTPNHLPILRDAGVVDSGGMGLYCLLAGMLRMLNGEPVVLTNQHEADAEKEAAAAPSWQTALQPVDEEGYGYDVQFLMLGEAMDVAQVRRDISAMGWSPLVDGDASLIKVHVHVHNPADPLNYAIQLGVDLDDIVVENMQAQYLRYVRDRADHESQATPAAPQAVAVIAVARGKGLQDLFRQYNAAQVIEGGQTMNPSTEDFLSAIDALHADKVIILPNNGNVIMAAEQAAMLARPRNVRVVPARTIPQGIAALLAYGLQAEDDDFDTLVASMQASLTTVITAEITQANRDVMLDGLQVSSGQFIGLLNGKLVTAEQTILDAVRSVLRRAHAEDFELLTFFYGEDSSLEEAEALLEQVKEHYPDLEYELISGAQPLYPYIISIE